MMLLLMNLDDALTSGVFIATCGDDAGSADTPHARTLPTPASATQPVLSAREARARVLGADEPPGALVDEDHVVRTRAPVPTTHLMPR